MPDPTPDGDPPLDATLIATQSTLPESTQSSSRSPTVTSKLEDKAIYPQAIPARSDDGTTNSSDPTKEKLVVSPEHSNIQLDDGFVNKTKPLYRSIHLLDGPLAGTTREFSPTASAFASTRNRLTPSAAHTSKRTLIVCRPPPSDQDRNGRPNMFRTRASIAIGPTFPPTCASYIAANVGRVSGLDDPG